MRELILENQYWQAKVSPQFGGNLHSLVRKLSATTMVPILIPLPAAENDSWVMGGNPFLFPFAGRVYDHEGNAGSYQCSGARYQLPIHGFASRLSWELIHAGPQGIKLQLKSSPATLRQFPFAFSIEHHYLLDEASLIFRTKITNEGETALPATPGWHPFFSLPEQGAKLCIPAAEVFAVDEKGLKGEGLPLNSENMAITRADAISLIVENADDQDPSLIFSNYKVNLSMDANFKTVVIWKPAGAGFVCVEPWSHEPNAIAQPETINFIPHNTSRSFSWRLSVGPQKLKTHS